MIMKVQFFRLDSLRLSGGFVVVHEITHFKTCYESFLSFGRSSGSGRYGRLAIFIYTPASL